MTISLRQLEYFVTVVDEGSFTRAAELLQVSQPGLSHQIQALERELGGPLLERLPRKVRLTPAGRTVLPGGLRIITESMPAMLRGVVGKLGTTMTGSNAVPAGIGGGQHFAPTLSGF